MSDETTTPESEESGDQVDPKVPAVPSRSRNPLSRDSDFVARPGFRSPANVRSKAQKKKKRR